MPHVLAISFLTMALVSAISPDQDQGTSQTSTKPNFSGVWIGIPPPTPDPPPPPGELVATTDWASPLRLTQDDLTLSVEWRTYSRSHALRKFVYRLDGTLTSNTLTGSADPQGRTSTAVWDGMKLVLTDTVDWPGPNGTRRRLDRNILSLESPMS